MNIYQESIIKLNNFFRINLRDPNCGELVFEKIKEIISFDKGGIFYLLAEGVNAEYTYKMQLSSKSIKNLESLINANEHFLISDLKIDNNTFGQLLIIRKNKFNKDESNIFETISEVVASLIKNIELNNIITLQIQAQQESIQELTKAYKTIQKQNKEILKADKIKNDFISHMSHELRTPLNSIIGFSDLLETGCIGELNEKQIEYVNDIKVSGLKLLGMINEVLDMAKLESGTLKLNISEFDLNIAILEAINILKALIKKQNLKIITKSQSLMIKADYSKIQQILFNLLSNAIKYTPPDGTITIRTNRINKGINIKIKDTGIGIETKYIKKIFNKFEQGSNKNCPNSTGLGLAITKELVKLHKGNITVESVPKQGTEFTVFIPC